MARLQTAALTLLLLLLVAVAPLDAAAPAARGGRELHFKWDVGYLFWNPDCGGERVMIGINGQFPGPTIRAKAGDTVVVELKNGLHTEGVVIHWHGISQRGTPWADGTASISQCAINPEETFTYRFIVDRPGTYFYHGHLGMQRAAGLYGSLIVDVADGQKEPFHYDGEFDLLLSDWYHKDIFSQMVGLSSNPFRWVGEPQSILINGRGQFNCSLASAQLGGGGLGGVPGPIGACSISSPQCQPVTLPVRPNKTYRIRLASTTSLASLNVAVGNHKLVVVEADGNYVQPFTVDNLDIYSGESYSVLLTTFSPSSKFSKHWLSVAVRGRKPATPPALAVLNYLPTPASKLATSPPPVHPVWNDFGASKKFTYQILALPGTPKPPVSADRRIVLLNTQNNINGGFIKWAINNVSLVLPPTPYLGALKHGVRHAFDAALPPDTFPPNYDVTRPPPNTNTSVGNGLYMLKFNSTVDVVLQNANALAVNVSEVHPWHLHGHDFWVLGYGEGKFDAAKDVAKFNLKNPPLRNTVVIFPYGWTALRFVADNPGVWAFHCHIEPHLHMGMGVVVAEGVDLVSSIPQEVLACGLTAKKLMRGGHHGHRH